MKIKNILVWKEKFAIVKSKKEYAEAFANIKYKDELTVIIDQNKIEKKDIIKIERNWKLITFNFLLNFNLVGFISKISSALAKKNISIFVVSSYSTDHLLVKEKDLKKTLIILKKIEVDLK
jgi:hypothetical protein